MPFVVAPCPRYKVFYAVVCVLVIVIEIAGGIYLLTKDEIKWQHFALIAVVGACTITPRLCD